MQKSHDDNGIIYDGHNQSINNIPTKNKLYLINILLGEQQATKPPN